MNQIIWQSIIEGTLDAIWLIDPIDLRVLMANSQAEQMLGFPAEGYVGMPVSELAATPEDVFFWEDVAAGLISHIRSETLFRHSAGHTLPVERSVSRISLTTADVVYVLAVRDLSEQRRVENELERLLAEMRATLESTADGIMVVDLQGAIRSYNQRFAELWALPAELMTERDDGAVFAWMAQAVLNSEVYCARLAAIGRTPLLHADDVIALRNGRVLERHTLPQYARGRPIGRVYSFRDVTQRLADERRLSLAGQVFERSLDAIFIADPEFRVISANPACSVLTGLPAEQLTGYAMDQLFQDDRHQSLVGAIAKRLAEQGHWEGEVWHRRPNGGNLPCLVSIVRVADEDGQTAHYIGFFKDLTETMAARMRIEELAYSDALTGLPNRLLLAERIAFSLQTCQRDQQPFAILFLDLDRFKQINDSLGHQFGDRVLIEVATRIKRVLRQADTAARLGGDEFVLLLHNSDAHGAEITARRILDTLCLPIQLDEMHFNLTCSIGIAMFPGDGTTMDDLIKNADSAMYSVKERGRSDFRFYQPQMNIDLLARMKLDHAMRNALAESRFRLHFQPQVDLRDGHIFGAEALLRWTDPNLGEVAPARFIPVAEETGLIVAIGEWVLREAVRQGAQWHAQGFALDVAVNVSAVQFRHPDFVDTVREVLREHAFPAASLELELTETVLVHDVSEVMRRLQALAEVGVRMSIDDFGTGYSSLTYLKRFPLHRLKIDRSFVGDLPHDESDAGIVVAIINMARALGLRVIAEGVENAVQEGFLRDAGCDDFQGYHCAAALPSAEFLELVRTRADGTD